MDTLIQFKFIHQLQNSYITNNEEEKAFSVLYKWSGKPEYTEWEGELMKHSLFTGHEDYDEYVLYKFRLPKNAKEALEKFISGSYSKYLDVNKLAIRNFIERRGFANYERIFKIMNLDEGIKLQIESELGKIFKKGEELSAPPDLELENFANSIKICKTKGTLNFN